MILHSIKFSSLFPYSKSNVVVDDDDDENQG